MFLALVSCAASAGALTLNEGMGLAVRASRAVKIAQQEEMVGLAEATLSRSPMLPSLNASVSQTFLAHQPEALFGGRAVPTSEQDFLSYGLSLEQTLYDFGGNKARHGSSLALLEAKRIDSRRIKNLAALDFANVFFSLLESERMIEVAEREAQRLQSYLKDAENLYSEGLITKNDVLQTKVRLADARQRLLTARGVREITASRVNMLIGRPLKAEVRAEDSVVAGAPLNLPETETAWREAGEARAEIKSAGAVVGALGLDEKSRMAGYYPKVFLKAGYDFMENQYQVHQENWSLVLGLKMNIFSGGLTRAEVARAGLKRLQAVERKEEIEDAVRLEVQRFVLELRNAAERLSVSTEAVGQAEENLKITRAKYEEGVGTSTEVLDAVALLASAESNYYKALYDLRRAEAGVLYSMGKDLTEVYR